MKLTNADAQLFFQHLRVAAEALEERQQGFDVPATSIEEVVRRQPSKTAGDRVEEAISHLEEVLARDPGEVSLDDEGLLVLGLHVQIIEKALKSLEGDRRRQGEEAAEFLRPLLWELRAEYVRRFGEENPELLDEGAKEVDLEIE